MLLKTEKVQIRLPGHGLLRLPNLPHPLPHSPLFDHPLPAPHRTNAQVNHSPSAVSGFCPVRPDELPSDRKTFPLSTCALKIVLRPFQGTVPSRLAFGLENVSGYERLRLTRLSRIMPPMHRCDV
ncbi:hypothetical protein M427DRAFT_58092 [Gonapodya prolifera JEL478]|uniref:Uncharacterized protein n=1 Tax=Gonapodya prolifera (strain JEL478) TaxID=1344416 RepID=A0A139AB02_GONPJ|nr:hypothetical protein M427DRAFT_58092 [Gonapodya prolifera JEL478]|eukprot:KXS13839.1 hypothetical protein M427DRAFT_58092 [Gonapodya prolifera JEL478]